MFAVYNKLFCMDYVWQDEQLGHIEIYGNSRARRIIMRPLADGVRITVPMSYDISDLKRVIEKYRTGLLDKQKIMQKRTVVVDRNFGISTDVFSLRLTEGDRNGFYVNTSGGDSVLICPRGIDYTASQDMLHKAVVEIMRRHAKRYLPARVEKIARDYGFTYKSVVIRSSRTRWGSCSARQHIALSLYLMALPSDLIDYVIKHELCHTVEMNHGPQFWALMDKVTDGRAKELRLRVHEHGMMII